MRRFHLCLLTLVLAAISAAARADELQPDRENKIVIQGRFTQQEPALLLIFSARPIQDRRGQPLASMSESQVASLKGREDQLVIKVHGKRPSSAGQIEYSFGTAADADMPWNDGREFNWRDWEKHSADLWDNVCVLAAPASGAPPQGGVQAVVRGLAIYRGGKLLYDSNTKASFPNKRRIDASLAPFDLVPRQGRFPLLNLAKRMEQFRRDYYELGDNPVLNLAYSDLAQTDKRKYANRGHNWCSEFSSYVYRRCDIMTPDPNRRDVHWKSMREFFEKNGRVYAAREVVQWPDDKKRTTIKPGSFVSILIGESTHSIIFTTWVAERGRPITRYVGVSGNNRGMVWPHSPLKLPTPEQLAKMTPDELREFDQKVYFAVPKDAR